VIKFYPDGYPFIIVSLLITGIVSVFLFSFIRSSTYNITFYVILFASCFMIVMTVFIAYFFRDPERNIPQGKGLFVSPADGKVILIKDVHENDYLKSDTKEISIFMSPLNVHVNRAPCDGVVSMVKYSPGKYMAAYRDDAPIKNENIVMVLDCQEYRVLVRQVAGFVARRAVCKAKAGDSLKRGERYGMIKFGSRLDVYMPTNTEIKVALGEKVKAGETVIGKIIGR
jgi:phosphatidylserine decarboxylase